MWDVAAQGKLILFDIFQRKQTLQNAGKEKLSQNGSYTSISESCLHAIQVKQIQLALQVVGVQNFKTQFFSSIHSRNYYV